MTKMTSQSIEQFALFPLFIVFLLNKFVCREKIGWIHEHPNILRYSIRQKYSSTGYLYPQGSLYWRW